MNTHSALSAQQVALPPADSAANSVFINVGGALVLVLLLFAAVTWLFRRSGMASRAIKGTVHLSLKSSLIVGQRERVVLVEVVDKWLLLGVTPQAVTCLVTMEKKPEEENEAPAAASGNFQNILLNMLNHRHAGERK